MPTELNVSFHRSIFLFAFLKVLSISGDIPTVGWFSLLLPILQYVPMYTLTPRLILSVRELYAHDVRGRRDGGIDSGFGVSLSGRGASVTEIVFADVEQNEGLEDIEEIRMEARTPQPE